MSSDVDKEHAIAPSEPLSASKSSDVDAEQILPVANADQPEVADQVESEAVSEAVDSAKSAQAPVQVELPKMVASAKTTEQADLASQAEIAKSSKSASSSKNSDKKSADAASKGWIRETIELVLMTLFLLAVIRTALAEARYIPSSSMEPTLQINDRILVEKVSGWMARPIERGDILVFYPPPIETGGKDINHSFLYELGRLTGLPCFPIDTAYIKRVVGLPGNVVKIQKGVGVFIDDQLLPESYIKECPDYDLKVLGDICGHNMENQVIKPYGDSSEPIYVPPGHLFMMGDNRNNSGDSHVWGFLDQKRVIGKSCLLFWRWFPEQADKKLVLPTGETP